MKINKIIAGFVVQTFDTGKGKYISQTFIADKFDYEHDDEIGTPLGQDEVAELGMKHADGLPFDMIQPLAVENCRKQIQEDLLALIDGQSQKWPEIRKIACQMIVVNNFKKFFGNK